MIPKSIMFVSLAAAFALAAAPGLAPAAMPNGSYSIGLGGNQSIWLEAPAEEDEFCVGFEEGFGGELESCNLSIFIDGKGKLSGSAQLVADNGEVFISLSGPVKGKHKGDDGSGVTSISFSMKLAGNANDGSREVGVSANIAFAGQIDAGGMMTGEWSYKLCAKGEGCFEDEDTITPEALEDGDWTLELDVDDLGGGRLGGEAVATFADDSQCSYTISGKYSAGNDESSLKLSPTSSPCDGTSVQLKQVHVTGPLMGDMSYKLFGSKGALFVESD